MKIRMKNRRRSLPQRRILFAGRPVAGAFCPPRAAGGSRYSFQHNTLHNSQRIVLEWCPNQFLDTVVQAPRSSSPPDGAAATGARGGVGGLRDLYPLPISDFTNCNANHCPYSKLHDFGPCRIEYTYFVMTPRATPTPDGCDGDGDGDGDENSEGDSGWRRRRRR
jgi:hypothetical protein